MLALLFPGQASQAVGMGTDLKQHSMRARQLYEIADEVTGLPISRLCAEGSSEELTDTAIAQPAVVVTSLAALAVVREEIELQATAVAGHSLGELAAYAAAGVFDERTALRVVHARAQAMAEACAVVDGGMAAVIGLNEQALRQACAEATHNGSSVQVANLNAPGQLVVSGARDAIERVGNRARVLGARRLLPLNVGGPFHSVYMRPAAAALSAALASLHFQPAQVPVVLNTTARPTQDPAALREEVTRQLYSEVRWIETLHELARLGCDRFLEVGPGQVLAGMVRRTLADAHVASFGSMADLSAVRSLVAERVSECEHVENYSS